MVYQGTLTKNCLPAFWFWVNEPPEEVVAGDEEEDEEAEEGAGEKVLHGLYPTATMLSLASWWYLNYSRL